MEATIACAMESDKLWPGSGILELGTGDYSTPLLHHISRVENRPMLSICSDASWFKMFRHFGSPLHEMRLINRDEWATFEVTEDLRYGFALMDSDETIETRFTRLKNLRKVGIVVLHDALKLKKKGVDFREMRTFFRNVIILGHRYPLVPGEEDMDAAVLSNYIDPAPLFHPDQVEVIA